METVLKARGGRLSFSQRSYQLPAASRLCCGSLQVMELLRKMTCSSLSQAHALPPSSRHLMVSENGGDLNMDPKLYYSPYYWDPKNGTPNLGKPPISWLCQEGFLKLLLNPYVPLECVGGPCSLWYREVPLLFFPRIVA